MKIEFPFISVPHYFRKHGWLKDPYMAAYLLWAFGRCRSQPQIIVHNGKKIALDAFEFISGRLLCSQETGLSERQIRTIQKNLNDQQLVRQTTSKTTNKYSVYKWSTALFIEKADRQIDQDIDQQSDHNQEPRLKDLSYTTPTPLKKIKTGGGGFYDCLKEIEIPEHRKVQLSSEYPLIRVELAVKYISHEEYTPKKGIIQTLVWHCKQPVAPEHSGKPKSLWEILALKHNQIYASDHEKGFLRNQELIKDQKMMIWQIDGFTPLSLGNPIEVLKEDFKKSEKEYKIALKNQKAKEQGKIEKMEDFA